MPFEKKEKAGAKPAEKAKPVPADKKGKADPKKK